MKKAIVSITTVALLLTSMPATFAANHTLVIDGKQVVSEAQAEIHNNRMMVPLRVVAEKLGVDVQWDNGVVTLSNSKTIISLNTNSNIATKNKQNFELDAKPYIKNSRLFVPLRFIGESFDATVSYNKNQVTVVSQPLYINGQKITSLQSEYHMTMGGVVSDIKGHINHKQFYELINQGLVEKVAEPELYGWYINTSDPGFYSKNVQYDFLNVEGKSVKQLDFYHLTNKFTEELINSDATVLIHDVNKNEWYRIEESLNAKIDKWYWEVYENGDVVQIENTVV